MKLVTVDQMRQIEKASDANGHTYARMMELAGGSVAKAIQARLDVRERRILFLIGPGNNGGDGLVAARVLEDAGAEVGIYLFKPRDDDLISALRERGVFIAALPDDRGLRFLRLWLGNCDILVDGLLGTGASRPIAGELAKLLNTVTSEVKARRGAASQSIVALALPEPASRLPLVVAVDGPSGLNYDTGELDPVALPADISVTFANPKVGHTLFPGAAACGELLVADIGTDPALAKDADLELADPALIRSWLPARPVDAHKGTFGKAMIAAGSIDYTGAPVLAATAAYRAGAGLVTIAPPQSIHAIVASKNDEATFAPLPDRDGVLNGGSVEPLIERLGTYAALLVGPGLTTGARPFIEQLFTGRTLPPLVVDADGLNILSRIDQWWTRLPNLTVLTPHPGEMSRLSRLGMKDIELDRMGAARKFARQWGHVVVLKGAFTVVAAPDDRMTIMPFANPALATAGSGDVLAGAITAMRSQGLNAYEAAVCGAYLHGVAGEIARREIGSAGVVAGDLLMRLPEALKLLH